MTDLAEPVAERPARSPASTPVFYFDVASPYAYLAAERIDDVMPGARWQVVNFGVVLRQIGRQPWSFPGQSTREQNQREVERRAVERGLPPVRWPEGWPVQRYSLARRLLLLAFRKGVGKQLTRALYRLEFADGVALSDEAAVVKVALVNGLTADEIDAAATDDSIKTELIDATNSAIELGLVGVPAFHVGDRLFWGDDQLERASSASAQS